MSRTGATVSVVRTYANPQEVLCALDDNRGQDLQVLARRDDSNLVALTLEIYTRQQQQQLGQSTLQIPSFVFSCGRKTSWSALKQLRADVLDVVATVETMSATAPHRRICEQCQRIAAYMVRCFEQPTVFSRAWNGSMVLSAKRVALVINTLLQLASCKHTPGGSECGADKSKSDECNKAAPNTNDACCTRAIVAVLAAFLVPDLAKSKTK